MTQKKPAKTTAAPKADKETRALNHAFEKGNFHAARVQAKAILANPEAPEPQRTAAQRTLKMTGIDPLALLAGLGAAGFTAVVAVLVGG